MEVVVHEVPIIGIYIHICIVIIMEWDFTIYWYLSACICLDCFHLTILYFNPRYYCMAKRCLIIVAFDLTIFMVV